MSKTKTTTTRTLRCAPGDLTSADLRVFTEDLPDASKVRVRTSYPDRPGELGEVVIEATITGGDDHA